MAAPARRRGHVALLLLAPLAASTSSAAPADLGHHEAGRSWSSQRGQAAARAQHDPLVGLLLPPSAHSSPHMSCSCLVLGLQRVTLVLLWLQVSSWSVSRMLGLLCYHRASVCGGAALGATVESGCKVSS
ncbi:hypothetical protein BS78_06G206100 [Paspalum vaginatum]|nr:hypothetical protein BS78_06G206100 [Paspalum vaginatum]